MRLCFIGLLGLNLLAGCQDPQMAYCIEHFEEKGYTHEKAVKVCEEAKKYQDEGTFPEI